MSFKSTRKISRGNVEVELPPGTGFIPEPADLAWSAGILDGEGCVTIGGGRKKKRKQLALHLIVAAAGCTGRKMTQKMQHLFGGYHISEEPRGGRKKRTYRWYCHGWKAVNILLRLYPFLCLKRKEAETAWKFQQLKKSSKRVSEANYQERLRLYEALRELHAG